MKIKLQDTQNSVGTHGMMAEGVLGSSFCGGATTKINYGSVIFSMGCTESTMPLTL
jgi:hypothetical protein